MSQIYADEVYFGRVEFIVRLILAPCWNDSWMRLIDRDVGYHGLTTLVLTFTFFFPGRETGRINFLAPNTVVQFP